MSDSATVLRRKLSPSRPSSVPGGSSVETLLRKTMPRDADDLLKLDLTVTSVIQGQQDKAALLAAIETTDLIYLLEGASGARGICKVSPGLLAALTEVQMSGRVSSSPPAERTPTRTDGIVAGDIIDRWMASAVQAGEDESLSSALPIIGFKRANVVLNKRNTDLSIDPLIFRTMTIEVSLGNQAKTGTLSFAVPETSHVKAGETSTAAAQMRRHIPDMVAPLRVVLARLPVGVERVRNLSQGDLLDVPIESLLNVRLEGMDGRMIAPARLGQLDGKKAVRLSMGGDQVKPMLAAAAGAAMAEVEPQLSDLPQLPDLPPDDLPDLPGLPSDGDRSELPDLNDISDLPDLPGLPDLPET